jgi:hypothetical protein
MLQHGVDMSENRPHSLEVREPAEPMMAALLPAIVVALATLAAGTASAYAPPATGELAVVFPPWTGEVEAFALVAQAGGQLVGPSRFGNIVIALAPDPGFAARVAEQGALFTVKATGICGPAST